MFARMLKFLGTLRRKPIQRPLLTAADFPFPFPILEQWEGELYPQIEPCISLLNERALEAGDLPKQTIHAADESTWKVVGVEPIGCGPQIFGTSQVYVKLAYQKVNAKTGLEFLRHTAQQMIENDPDDVWNQEETHDALIARVRQCESIAQLARVLAAQHPDEPAELCG